MSEYKDRDSMKLDELGGYYCKHIAAMTAEGLHSKSAIADELAWRDMIIDRQQSDIKQINQNTFTYSAVEKMFKETLDKFWENRSK